MNNQEIRSIMIRKFYDYNQENPGDFLDFEEFTKLGMSNDEITVNARYLNEKGLLTVGPSSIGTTFPSVGIITAVGMDVIEGPETIGSQFPFVQNNIQIIRGDITGSVLAQSSGDQIINISESFNQIYNRIDATENLDSSTRNGLKKDVKELEEHLNEDKIDLEWIKEKSSKIKEKASWAIPIIQNIIIEIIKIYFNKPDG